ncbi:MAG: hypothetical protein ABI771_17005 [Betaproteobacteria bacterium]
MLANSLPARGYCPACGGEFLVVSRTGEMIGTLAASDVLGWKCSACGHHEDEARRLSNGFPGSWPLSKFNVVASSWRSKEEGGSIDG